MNLGNVFTKLSSDAMKEMEDAVLDVLRKWKISGEDITKRTVWEWAGEIKLFIPHFNLLGQMFKGILSWCNYYFCR